MGIGKAFQFFELPISKLHAFGRIAQISINCDRTNTDRRRGVPGDLLRSCSNRGKRRRQLRNNHF